MSSSMDETEPLRNEIAFLYTAEHSGALPRLPICALDHLSIQPVQCGRTLWFGRQVASTGAAYFVNIWGYQCCCKVKLLNDQPFFLSQLRVISSVKKIVTHHLL